MTNLRYEPVNPATKAELIERLKSQDPRVVADALHAATRREGDWEWAQDLCVEGLRSPEVAVRWAAATCLGDLAFDRRPLDLKVVLPALELAVKDPLISDPAKFSLSMVRQFLGGQES
jgi:hypothetical protein